MTSVVNSDQEIKELRADLRRIPPPYLLRKYDADPEDFEVLAEENLKCEYLNGVLIVHSPATLDHEALIHFLTLLLGNYAASRHLGQIYGSNAVMQLDLPRFCPDISFLKTESRGRIRGGRVVGPMDLAVEVLSKSTRDFDLGEKRKAYHDGLVPEIWLIDPGAKQTHIDSLQDRKYASQTLAGGEFESRVVAGFKMKIDWLWADPLPDPLACLGIRV